MHIGKSIEIALVKKELKKKDLAAGLNTTSPYISHICSRESCSSAMIEKLAAFFDMPVSDFIKLGE